MVSIMVDGDEADGMNIIYQDEVLPPAIGRGAGEAPYWEDEFSSLDFNHPTDHGDYSLPNATFYNTTHVNEIDLPFDGLDDLGSVDSEDLAYDGPESEEDGSVWLSDSEGDDTDRQYGLAEPGYDLLAESEDDDGYVPISRFLSSEEVARDDWYEDPRGEDFRTAFSCLKNKKYIAKKYLLDILTSEKEDEENNYQIDMDPNIQDEITYALSDLLIPGLSKMSVEKLCDLLVKYPSLDLRGYLIDMDVYHIAYVIWGIDFYMHKKYGGYLESDSLTENESDSEENSNVAESLKKCLNKSLSWVLESFAPTAFARCKPLNNS